MSKIQPLSQEFISKLRFNDDGLIPAIAQDWLDGAVLMMAWMNHESLDLTISTGEVHYWSRSRSELWHKGSSSGHTQVLKGIRCDCDADVLLLSIQQTGNIACHTGKRSCFYISDMNRESNSKTLNKTPADAFSELFEVIQHRKLNPEEGSYTNKLLEAGDNKILKKIGEEAAEFVMACMENDKGSIANEAADLIFHLQVSLANHEVRWEEVLKVIAERRGAPRRS